MRKRILSLLFWFLVICQSQAQTLNSYYQSVVLQVKYDSILHHLQSFENFGTKSPASQSLVNTSNWLVGKYQLYGYSDVVRDTFSYQGNTLFNIVATKTGNLFPNKCIIVCGHYDTNGGSGTNDNGSGVSIILEVARLLKDIPTEYSVRFINFSAEESGFIGSQHYVDDIVVPQNMDILLVFNIDEVGGVAGQNNNTITCEYDNGWPLGNNLISQHYTDTLELLTGLYSSLQTIQASAYGSDYMPFEDNSEIISGYFETIESNFVHSASDNLSHLDTSYVVEIARAATGATLYFAKGYEITVSKGSFEVPIVRVFPNPCDDFLKITGNIRNNVTIRLFDEMAREILTFRDINIPYTLVTATLKPAFYYFIISDSDGIILRGHIIKQP